MRMLLLFFLVIFSAGVRAEWTKSFAVDYVLGDGDNRASARQAALEQIKLKASSEAGSYVLGTTTLHEDGAITENVQMISASMVKLVVSGEKLSVNQSGQAVLWIKAEASLDDSVLSKRVAILQNDKEKERQVKVLQAENDQLRHDYEQIRKALASKSDQHTTADLLTKQDQTIKLIADNGKNLTNVFERGTLIQLANQNADAFTLGKRYIDEHFYAAILESPVTAEIESVEADGKGYVALVRFGWEVNVKHAMSGLNDYIKASSKDNPVLFRKYENLDSTGPSVLSQRLFNYMAKQGVDLKLTLSGKEVRLPIFYGDKSFFNDCSLPAHSARAETMCLVQKNIDSSENQRFYPVRNPVRISLTREEAERATTVEASLVLNTESE